MRNFPSVFKLLILSRLISAFFNPIDDCDEAFNFYEPLHKLMYGNGLQTWEYSPLFALRSYAYIVLHWLPIAFIPSSFKFIAFYALRICLSIVCAMCEAFFFRAIDKQLNSSIARNYAALSIFNVALFRSSSAFINNSFSMYTVLFAYTCWFSNALPLAVFFIAFGSLCGWIYVAVLGIPIAIDIFIRRQRYLDFIKWSLISGVITLVPLTLIDSYYYGKLVIAPLNHIGYNIFSKHGPTLYGTEPWTYYITNGLLNFNIIYPLAIIGIMLTPFIDIWTDRRYIQSGKAAIPYTMIVSSILLWMGLLWMQPHKEDRFIFPIYPLIILAASICIEQFENFIPRLVRLIKLKRDSVLYIRSLLFYSIIILHGILSISRTIAIVDGYSAPIRLLTHSNTTKTFELEGDRHLNICIGKDWYRFPSHFLLPQKSQLAFLRSEFRGQLPKTYSDLKNATQLKDNHFNDANKEEMDRYVSLNQCDYIIDHDSENPSELQPNYSQQSRIITSMKMIAPSKRSIFRSFYVPFLSVRSNRYTFLHLLKYTKFVAVENK
ncbi:unnamed protein product [Adineta steineri]|uniref:Mannosyltransferase n=1 Tax=Adineta steineri TaxID=433720 RepID=A0A815P3G9_9BILA|nr:unnamed protein product [Adineta steineri]CAF3912250.1 unnamed protein product [Adineta steineri]